MHPTAPPSQNPAYGKGLPALQNDGGAREFLLSYHWPAALQESFITNISKTPLRYFICDDSGSMGVGDGSKLVSTGNGNYRVESCTRMQELANAMKFHVGLAKAAAAPTEFRFLNALQPLRVGFDPMHEDQAAIDAFLAQLDSYPSGGTPLCRHIREITHQIENHASALRASGQKAVIIIATDGESSDGNVAEALRPLKNLPVWVIVRLCTNDDNIENYWNSVDRELELNMDVIDDHMGEGREISKINPFLNYGEPLHRFREFGVTIKEFDLIDEKKLTKADFHNICKMIYGDLIKDLPNPEADLPGFLNKLKEVEEKHKADIPYVWNPVSKKLKPWISQKKAMKTYEGGKCVIM